MLAMSSAVTSGDKRAAEVIRGPDAHGQAAMLLVESLIHGLISKKLITAADAVEIVEIASDVKVDKAVDLGDSTANLVESLKLLEAISASLNRDGSAGDN